MLNPKYFLCGFLFFFCLSVSAADDGAESKSQQVASKEQQELTSEAKAIAAELRSSLPADSEAIAMLDDILSGSHLSSEDGWFVKAKAASRFDWKYVLERYDANQDGSVQRDEFPGQPGDFKRLDRSDDQVLQADDFDWQEHSLTPTPGLMMFFMGDSDANGKLTREEFAGLYDKLAAGEEFLALDELRQQFTPPTSNARDQRPDRPSRSTLVVALRDQEIGSLQPGPNIGEPAPDFTLDSLRGMPVTLSQEVGEKPIVLIFGNFTCGPFRSQSGNLEKLYERYRDRAKFFLVYVREAHPKDGWWMLSNQRIGIEVSQPKLQSERRSVAETCQATLDLEIPFLVDTLDDRVGSTYSGMPNRLYLIDQKGEIAFKNGRGPFGFHPRQLEQALVLLLNDIQ